MTQQLKHRAFARTDRSRLSLWWWQTDRTSFYVVFFIMMFGLLLSASTSADAAKNNHISDSLFYVKRHFIFVIGSLIGLVGLSSLSLKGVKRVGLIMLSFSILAMVAIVFFGDEAKGGKRWLNLGPMMLQPSEFFKPAFVIIIAWMFSEARKTKEIPGVSITIGLYIVAIGLLMLQPDVGQSVLLTATFASCFFIAGVPLWAMGSLVVLMALSSVSLFFIHSHVKKRILEFINPEGDHTQIDYARAAIANGRLSGQGYHEGTVKAELPDLHTDFAFSVFSEEFGLILSLVLILMFGYFILRNLLKAFRTEDSFRQIAIAGLTLLLGFQVLINISVNLAIIPPKGMTLPFISYGGSSLLASGITVGLLLALTRKRQGDHKMVDDDASQW